MKYQQTRLPNAGDDVVNDRGFTLAELTIVLFIIGLVLISVTPRLSILLNANPEDVARRLEVTIRSCREETIMTHRPLRIVFNLDQQTYFVETVSEQALDELRFELDTSVLRRPVKLPRTVHIVDVTTPLTGKVKEGEAYLPLLSDGLFIGALLHLKDEENQVYTLTFKPLTGRLTFEEGYLYEEMEYQET